MRNPIRNLTSILAVATLAVACGDTELMPITGTGSLLAKSTPSAIAIPLADLEGTALLEEVSFTGSYETVLVVSNRPMSCEEPLAGIGCNASSGWAFAVPIPTDADLTAPLEVADTIEQQIHVSGAGGCSKFMSHRVEHAGAALRFTADGGALQAELSDVEDFVAGEILPNGTHNDFTYSVNGPYPVARCSGTSQLDAL